MSPFRLCGVPLPALDTADPKHGSGFELDVQSFGLETSPFAQGHEYCWLASTFRQFKLTFLRRGGNTVLATKTWGYAWSNDICEFQNGDTPIPPFTNVSVDYKNSGKGDFSFSNGIDGVEDLN